VKFWYFYHKYGERNVDTRKTVFTPKYAAVGRPLKGKDTPISRSLSSVDKSVSLHSAIKICKFLGVDSLTNK